MDNWYYLVEGVQQGPVDEATLRALLETEQIPPETFLWKEGMENWAPAVDIPVFFPPVAQPPPFIQPTEDAVAAAAVQRAAAEGTSPVHSASCVACKAPGAVPGFPTLLCQPCRETLSKAPVPLWLKITAGALAAVLIFAATRIPREIGAAIAYEQGQIAEDKGKLPEAMQDYQKALVSYPDSPDVLRKLARLAYQSGDQAAAAQYAQKLISPSGEVAKEDIDLINQIKGGKS